MKLTSMALFTASTVLASVACSGAPIDDNVDETADALVESKHLGMTDVTVLYPLPRTSDHYDDLMSPSSEGARGELFTAEVFEQLAALKSPPMLGPDGKLVDRPAPLFAPWSDRFANLRVLGIRLDPCFGESTNLGASTCVNTVRLVTQFVDPTTPAASEGVDGRVGIHLFYTISRSEMTTLLRGMLALRTKAGLPLQKGFVDPRAPVSTVVTGFGVNPTLATEGLRGPYATALRDLILNYAGSENLSQVAFCVQDRGPARFSAYYGENSVSAVSNRWAFGRFDVKQGNLYAQSVSTLNFAGIETSDIEPRVQPNLRPVLVVNPAPQTPDAYFPRFNQDSQAFDAATWDTMNKAAFNFLNPKKYTARNSDCVSCHLADQATEGTPRNLLSSSPNAFKSNTYRLGHTTTGAAPFRMFGWTGATGAPGTVVSSRVVNETAMVLDYVNKSILK